MLDILKLLMILLCADYLFIHVLPIQQMWFLDVVSWTYLIIVAAALLVMLMMGLVLVVKYFRN